MKQGTRAVPARGTVTKASRARRTPTRPKAHAQPRAEWELRIYVAGQTPRSLIALTNLKRLCEEHLKGRYRIEIVDLLLNPQLSRDDQILAVPTLVRKLPQPIRKIIGDLSNAERVLVGLQIRPDADSAGTNV